MSPADETRLDNPAYAALTGPHARFARISGRALRYPPDVAPFLALPSRPSGDDWRDAIEIVPPGTYAGLVHDGAEVPDGWETLQEFEVVQMLGEQVSVGEAPEAVRLGDDDVPEMLDLVSRTDPGPFLTRTIELGDYLGIRSGDELVAMAGERLHLDGWTEISAVCTAPSQRGHGLRRGSSARWWPASTIVQSGRSCTFSPPTRTRSGSMKLSGSASGAR